MGSDDMADGAASNRAIAYVRVSTTRQAEEGNSIASQSVRILKYAKDKGLRLMSRDIIIDEGVQRYGATGEIAATLQEHAFDYLDGPVLRIGAADVPVPFSPPLELPTIPDATRVVEAVQSLRVR